MKIKVLGKDKQGWSIDKDRYYTEKALKELGYKIGGTAFTADIIYNVWYSYIRKIQFFYLRKYKGKRKLINVVTNDPEDTKQNINRYKPYTDYWVCANQKQKQFLLKNKIPEECVFINPFYVDDNIFKPLEQDKKKLASYFNIPYAKIDGFFLIGSFQRDSSGKDLTKPKWHKNPKLLIETAKALKKQNVKLLLAGPRRHYIVHECRKLKIPYVFVGNEAPIDKMQDDVSQNNLPYEQINRLYNLSDLYIISSASEGGPKAVSESALCRTAVLSTPVGLAPDLLSPESICKDKDEFINTTKHIIKNKDFKNKLIRENFKKVSEINKFDAYKSRIKYIIETVRSL